MINFDTLVDRVAQNTFARPVGVLPVNSQPGALAYDVQSDGVTPVRGIWTILTIDVQTQEGIMSSRVKTLDVRVSEFTVPCVQGDRVVISTGIDAGIYLIDDVDDDGQGAAKWTLKELREYQ